MFDHISSLDTYYELDITERTIPQNTEKWASPALEGTQKKKKEEAKYRHELYLLDSRGAALGLVVGDTQHLCDE